MKRNYILAVLLLFLTGCLSACGNETGQVQTKPGNETSLVDSPVVISPETRLLNLPIAEKESAYANLDKIAIDTKSNKLITDYSQMIGLNSQADYQTFLDGTFDQPAVIYLGFDECPYCRAFSPKVNQIASELDVPIYYYDIRERQADQSFATNVANYEIDTVPHVFIVENGQPRESLLNHESQMTEIESFLKQVAK